MFFISKRTKAQFYNMSQMTFLVQKDSVDIIFKVQRCIYFIIHEKALKENNSKVK